MSKELHEKATEILAQVLDLSKEKALLKIDELCKEDNLLKSEVLSLYSQMTSLENQALQESSIDNSSGSTKHVRQKQGTQRSKVIGEWTRKVFTNKRYRLILVLTVFGIFVYGGYSTRSLVRKAILKSEKEEKLALLNTNRKTLETWINNELKRINAVATTTELIKVASQIDSIYKITGNLEELTKTEEYRYANELLMDINNVGSYSGVSLLHSKEAVVLANSYVLDTVRMYSPITGLEIGEYIYEDYKRASEGRSVFIPPFNEKEAVRSLPENYRPGAYCAFTSPVFDNQGNIIMIVLGTYRADRQFTTIMQTSNHGNSAETYAVDKLGRMISSSRFEKELQKTILLNYDSTKSSIYNLTVKDPKVKILNGEQPKEEIINLEFTNIVKEALVKIQRKDTSHTFALFTPYRDYRGVPVVGAYTWFDEYEFGIISEEDAEEALAVLTYVDYSFDVFYVVVFILLFLLYNSNVKIARIGKKIEDFERLGQYKLLKKVGEGGFGSVYLAEHSFLKMKVAIKILKNELSSSDLIHRFEREVKLTSSLSSPNTVRVFDYGTSDKNSFYYVMEYLDGVTLYKIVDMENSIPLARVVFVLRHVCLSLFEAHKKGLIHRDIKPMNIMLCKQGENYDEVKVLDFGLVKNLDSDTQQTQLNKIGGTPMFMSPERLRDPLKVDQRADIYAIGCVGYYMLSGQFLVELISQKMLGGQETLEGHLKEKLIEREDIPAELDELLKSCIHFNPDKRPSSIKELLEVLDNLQTKFPWSRTEAQKWWRNYDVYGNS